MQSAVQPVLVEVLAHIPTDFFHCAGCERLLDVTGLGGPVHKGIRTSYPPEILEDARHLGEWLEVLSERYGERLRIRVVDVASPEGFLKAFRHRVRTYPAFIINERTTCVGWDAADLDRAVEREMTRKREPR